MYENKVDAVELPCGKLCYYNCDDKCGCAYFDLFNKDNYGRQYCRHYGSYYYPYEGQGCLSYG